MRFRPLLALVALALASAFAVASPDRVRFLEGADAAAKLSPDELAIEPTGYLTAGVAEIASQVPPPPPADSEGDKMDVSLFRQAASASAARWEKAVADDASVYNRFSEALGLPIDRSHLPRLVRLLNRVSVDALAAAGEAKKHYPRPRPYQRFQIKRMCGQATPPKPETKPTTGTSYPSGHAAVGWAVALVLMEVVPSQMNPLMNRAVEYGQSRVICGVHFTSDVEAGRLVGAALLDKLATLPEFRRDVACARREYKGVAAGERSEDQAACF